MAFLAGSLGFWRLGQTVLAKAYVIPLLVVAALIIAFVSTPIWRASAITAVARLIVILLVDGTAHARIEGYY